jgi:flagellar biosynthesis/type III secretory pathway chaperone
VERNQRDKQRANGVGRGTGVSKITSADLEKLSNLLDKEYEILEQIRKLTEKQSELLTKDKISEFDSSLDKRAELIEKINGLHQDSDALMQSYMSLPENEKNKKIEKLREQIQGMLKLCAELNDKNMAELKEKTEEHIRRIDKMNDNIKGIGGYAQAVPNAPELFDKKT